ncbi:MAG: amino acid permease [Lactobacillus sp.]
MDEAKRKYSQLTAFKLFAMTSSMVISVDELAPFGKTGPSVIFYLLVAGLLWFIPITQMAGEMASIDGWNRGGIFTWVQGTLGEKTGWEAMFLQWIHITVGMDTMMYVIIGALSITLGTPWFNTTPIVRFGLMMLILWGATAIQLIGVRKIGQIAEWLFILGSALPVVAIIVAFFVYLAQGHQLHMVIRWSNILPKSFNTTTLVAFVPFILAFCGGEASAPHVKNLKNPHSYSRVMLALALTAICFDLLGSLAIGMSVPKSEIQNSTGFVYTYGVLMNSIGLPGKVIQKVAGVLLACGIIGEIGNWLAGPNQGMHEAAKQGYLPKLFAKTTKRGVPMPLMVLQSLVVTASALLITFTSGANADFAFNISLAATTAQYLMVYLIMLVAFIVLKARHEDLHRTYYMSKHRGWSIFLAGLAFVITAFALLVAFTPAAGTPAHLRSVYFWDLLGMCVIVAIIPLVLYHFKPKWQQD